jgi:hypothetical protein
MTSLIRTDTGKGACEVMYVESVKEDMSPVPVAAPAAATPAPGVPKA